MTARLRRLLIFGVAACVGWVAHAPAAVASAPERADSPVQVFGWKVCEPRAGGWELTWAIVNLGAEEFTIDALSRDLSGVRVGDAVPAYQWVVGREIAPRGTAELSLEAVLEPTAKDAAVSVSESVELGPCFGPGGRPGFLREKEEPAADLAEGESAILHYSGCEALALVAAGPDPTTFEPSTGEVVEVQPLPGEPSDVVVFPADGDLTVEVAAGATGESVSWERPNGCGGIPSGAVAAVGAAAVALVALGVVLLVRSRRSERAR